MYHISITDRDPVSFSATLRKLKSVGIRESKVENLVCRHKGGSFLVFFYDGRLPSGRYEGCISGEVTNTMYRRLIAAGVVFTSARRV